ncbi:ATP-binding protein [Providencia rettgeri]|uniref:ATP-binding protein n=1 Tax=Providencia rettgeri TaxID=587 RepID=UPI0018E490D7|nr:ATP-binding protein [Providencia rettgeri]MBI6202557.1 ATP-binding protein [Providencia rettgeri]
MAQECIHPPSAACLSASMRDLGYSLETSIADLIDNSISAGADTIEIYCDIANEQPVVAIIDNGIGMEKKQLLIAMRHGARSPKQSRTPQDLGRFGLGLKTASFSQCRSLTVVSKRDGNTCGAEWDLDSIDAVDDWVLSILDDTDIQILPYLERLGSRGTAVIWRQLDRLMEDEEGDNRQEIVNDKLATVSRHLSLVFHRFISGEIKGYPRITLSLNGHIISGFDPFCKKNPATQILPEEIVRIGTDEVRIQPYVLPHHSRLSISEYTYYQDRSNFISNQGIYIYRNGRLMVWGDWFRLTSKSEATKLARVQIDFPNSLDEAWTIDIKKSRAYPPLVIRERLRQIISQITARSTIIHRGRGQKLYQEISSPIWERFADQSGIRYTLNCSHPILQRLKECLDGEDIRHLELFIETASSSLPIEMMYSDYSTHPLEVKQAQSLQNVQGRLHDLKQAIWGNAIGSEETFRDIVRSTRLFDDYMEVVEEYIKREFI